MTLEPSNTVLKCDDRLVEACELGLSTLLVYDFPHPFSDLMVSYCNYWDKNWCKIRIMHVISGEWLEEHCVQEQLDITLTQTCFNLLRAISQM